MSEIPDAAITAGAKALGTYSDEQWERWVLLPTALRAAANAEAVLTAAYPYLAAQVLRDAADDVVRVRVEGLLPHEMSAPSSYSTEKWLRDKADELEAGNG